MSFKPEVPPRLAAAKTTAKAFNRGSRGARGLPDFRLP